MYSHWATKSMTSPTRIAIVGGGPGGLTLARILYTRGIAATVFERDAHALERPQGGTLDLHVGSGQAAMRQAGLDAAFKIVARYEDQGMRVLDKTGKVLLDQPGGVGGDRPEVDRTELRRILVESLRPETVRWGYVLCDARPVSGGTVRLDFANGDSGDFDLVVGADGAWSRVRRLVSDAVPFYTGVAFVEIGLDDVDRRHPAIARLVGRGGMAALGDSKGIIAQRNGNAHIRTYVAFRAAEDWLGSGAIDLTDARAARRSLAAQFEGWAPEILSLVHEGGDTITPRLLYTLPVGHKWTCRRGVTLLGDAAHLMTPFGGNGVNFAMLDAAELAIAIADGGGPDAIEAYETKACERAAPEAAEALNSLLETFSELGPRQWLEHMSGGHGASRPRAAQQS
jgi:2-polyprenyl-6-methoxyphenol hydroxylase-like FAD-dependent oxidoreductase